MKAPITTAGLILSLFIWAGCDSGTTPDADAPTTAQASPAATQPAAIASPASASAPATTNTAASIAATPNPVPAGEADGKTTVTWKMSDGSNGQVYVKVDGAAESLFAAAPQGSQDADWIKTGSTYEFRLYKGADHAEMVSSVTVTRAP